MEEQANLRVTSDQAPVVLLRDSFRTAKRIRVARVSGAAAAPAHRLVLANVRCWDAQESLFSEGLRAVVVEGETISAVSEDAAAVVGAAAARNDIVIDCGGMWLLPGLCDAHVHCTAVTADLAGLQSLPESLVTAGAAEILGGMLLRGFTTVRDAGGADWGLAQAVDDGSILGPRILFTGAQLGWRLVLGTGGHGDFRGKGEDCCACGAALRGIGRVCDGVGECRRAARDELRRGAHCIKVMASGGVASPTDRLTNTQFSLEELRAIVEEAEAAGTYVCAHAYKPSAIKRALQCGVRSIEHGNWLDEECAAMMVERGAFLVSTTVTYAALRRDGVKAGMAEALVAKVADAVEQGLASIRLARSAGVTLCFGSDLLGELHQHQSEEFLLRAQAGVTPVEAIQQATSNCARLFGLEDVLGAVAPGRRADLVLLSRDPSLDASALAEPQSSVRLVIKEGLLAAVPGGTAGAALAAANTRL
ncbi:amidohydrolase [Monoraphidium neglectum]|uniref:Amidohydrolase n=1 Tax=Monoraphidium neglectum TaxID=145388 RepID=A0A0D2LLE6_9CHLO|nr:amidohydrolase [Monoraphidium neglectum]KIZ07154.1 amidohydrolase [Monoraphidium neglectum]|eukprot:XP_013906173.1 amidohydrolase [Monoraphidium neglectum]